MADERYLSNQFLVAMPGLEDSNFSHSVTLLCEHSEKGALGLIINRPTNLKLSDLLDQMGLEHGALRGDPIVYWGGPVQPERGFVVHDAPGDWESTLQIDEGLYITTSRDILDAIARGAGPSRYIVTLGYAGWGEGQLESEIMNNAWLNTPVDRTVLFGMPAEERWLAATKLIGLDVRQLASMAGHA
ncbi:MAG: YqgE/AlgH family protein [Sinobacteraceae bacterium]|nr:YqgE/AlgH family protein [Nevskia sp.]MDI3258336.1 YqgE/AlgH family protein [Nevskiaceae bacterium]